MHAIRNLSRIAFGRAKLRWSQLGYGRTSKTTSDQQTPRNLFGYKDGTANILADDTAALEDARLGRGIRFARLDGGRLVPRRPQDRDAHRDVGPRAAQRAGPHHRPRRRATGAPLSGGGEYTEPDFAEKDAAGAPKIDVASHVRLAHPEFNDGIRILRRGYNFVDGNNDLGRLDAGLFFLSYQRSPEQFVTLQRSLSTDVMLEYIRHVRSGIWAVPPGAAAGSYVGAALFA